MPKNNGRTIAVIGAGFSGALLTLHLLKRCAPQDRVLLIEKNQRFGLGLAYSTGNPNHVLNVRASNMSAYADRPDHFVQWLRSLPAELRAGLDEEPGPNSFVPRGLFGRYIQQMLGDRIWRQGNDKNVFLVTDEAVALHPRTDDASGWDVELAVGRRLPVDQVVLAMGNLPPTRSRPGVFNDPWHAQALDQLDPMAPVLLIGTGLTTVDTVISLLDRGHRGHIHAISRRGQLPRMHGAVNAPWRFAEQPSAHSLRHLMRQIRATVREAAAQGVDWRAVIDGLRPHTQRLWLDMPLAERKRFLRHLRPWWDVHRHRMAPRIHARIQDAITRGQLTITAARLGRVTPCAGVVEVEVQAKSGSAAKLTVERVIDCSGLQGDITKLDRPLVRQLLSDGVIRADHLGLGIETTVTGAVISADGAASDTLFAIGPITKGTFWEIVAVPDIRRTCEQVAADLTDRPSMTESVAAAPDGPGATIVSLPKARRLRLHFS